MKKIVPVIGLVSCLALCGCQTTNTDNPATDAVTPESTTASSSPSSPSNDSTWPAPGDEVPEVEGGLNALTQEQKEAMKTVLDFTEVTEKLLLDPTEDNAKKLSEYADSTVTSYIEMLAHALSQQDEKVTGSIEVTKVALGPVTTTSGGDKQIMISACVDASSLKLPELDTNDVKFDDKSKDSFKLHYKDGKWALTLTSDSSQAPAISCDWD